MKKWIGVAIALLAIGGGGYYGYETWFKEKPASAAVQRTAQVTRGDIAVTVSGSGTVGVARKQEVKTTEAGTIAQVLFEEGDLVKEGQTLVVYEAPDLDDQIEQIDNTLAKQEMQMENLKSKYIAAQEDARASISLEIETLKLDMEANRANLADLKEEAEKVVSITAPLTGKISAPAVEAGQQVQSGTVIATISDYENLQSVIQVDELDVTKIKVGQTATVTLDALEDAEIEGKVTKIADEGTATNGVSVFDVTIAFKAVEGVKSGMTSQAEILVERKEDVLMLPIEAVREFGGQKAVQLAGEDVQAGSAGQAGNTGQAGSAGQAGFSRRPADAAASAEAGNAQTPEGDDAPAAPAENPDSFAEQPEQFGQRRMNAPMRQGADSASTEQDSGNPPQTRQDAGDASSGQGRFRTQGPAGLGNMRIVTVGIHNDSYIEIVSGLEEGDVVVLPAIVSASNAAQGFPGAGGGFGGAGGGVFPAGGFGAGSGFVREGSGAGLRTGGAGGGAR